MPPEAIRHFKKADPKLHAAIIRQLADGEKITLKRRGDPFSRLCRIVAGQQLSGYAAISIFNRFQRLFPNSRPKPELVLKMSEAKLKKTGFSKAKIKTIKHISQSVISGRLDFQKIKRLSDEEVREKLTAVPGIGPWTAEMFLLTALAREDIFSPGDLGLRKAVAKLYGLKNIPDQKKAEKIARRWSPYRSYASRVLWDLIDSVDGTA